MCSICKFPLFFFEFKRFFGPKKKGSNYCHKRCAQPEVGSRFTCPDCCNSRKTSFQQKNVTKSTWHRLVFSEEQKTLVEDKTCRKQQEEETQLVIPVTPTVQMDHNRTRNITVDSDSWSPRKRPKIITTQCFPPPPVPPSLFSFLNNSQPPTNTSVISVQMGHNYEQVAPHHSSPSPVLPSFAEMTRHLLEYD